MLLVVGAGVAVGWRDAARFLAVADPIPARADAIVVMAGSIGDRTLEAARLYEDGVAPRVLVTRERPSRATTTLAARGVRLPEGAAITRDALTGLGVPAAAITVIRRRATSTRTEARAIARYACSHGLRSLVVVTSPSHTRRARLILRQTLGPSVALSVRPTRAVPYPAHRWWRVHELAKQVLREYEKLAHYWLRERWSIEPCGGLARR